MNSLSACQIQSIHPGMLERSQAFDVIIVDIFYRVAFPVPLFYISDISVIECNILRTNNHAAALMSTQLGIAFIPGIIVSSLTINNTSSGNRNIRRIPDSDCRFHRLCTLLQTVYKQCIFIQINVQLSVFSISVPIFNGQTGPEICTCREINRIQCITVFHFFQCCLKCFGYIIFLTDTFIRKHNLFCIICHILTFPVRPGVFCSVIHGRIRYLTGFCTHFTYGIRNRMLLQIFFCKIFEI